ncbi:hypothetical protein BZA77DRAFT_230420, partial [Pyronema omphalodes]
ALTPLPFFAVGIMAASLNGKPISGFGKEVGKYILLIPTLYPILFAALAAHALRCIALRLSEKGTTLGRLEQLLGSLSFGSTVLTNFWLRWQTPTSFALIAMWSLSPLGGQASLRMLSVHSVITDRIPTILWYRNPGTDTSSFSAAPRGLPRINGLFMSAMFAPEANRDSSQDIYGNIKIPMLEESTMGPDGWADIDHNQTVTYSSLLGIPVVGQPPDGNGSYEFTLTASYFRPDCYTMLSLPWNDSRKQYYGDLLYGSNRSFFIFGQHNEDKWRRSAPLIRNDTGINATRLVFASRNLEHGPTDAISYTWAECYLTTSHVDAMINCIGPSCRATRIRHSILPQRPKNLTVFDGTGITTITNFFNSFSVSAGPATAGGQCSAIERYINDPTTAFVSIVSDCVDLYRTPRNIFSARLGQLMNTFWGAGLTPTRYSFSNFSLIQPPPDVARRTRDNHTMLLGDTDMPLNYSAPFLAMRAYTDVVYENDRYVLSWPWFVIFIFSTVVLVIVSMVGAVVQWITIAPDVLGYVSSFTRDNPFVKLDAMGDVACTQDGIERAKALKNLKVRLADVNPGEEVGHVAFVSGEYLEGAGKLRKGRSY